MGVKRRRRAAARAGGAAPGAGDPAEAAAEGGGALWFRVFGMKRAGNHAVIGWMLRNAPGGRFHHLNNCAPRADPYRGCWQFATEAGVVDTARQGAWAPEGPPPGMVVASYEDLLLSERLSATGRVRLKWPHPPARDVYVHRGFLNWLASYMRVWELRGQGAALDLNAKVFPAVRLWALNLDFCAEDGDRPLAVDFDRWSGSADYRRDLAGRLGIELRDDSTDAVSAFGGGSSFDGVRLDGRAGEMAVGERWRHYADDPRFWEVIALSMADPRLKRQIAAHCPDHLDIVAAHITSGTTGAARPPREEDAWSS